MLFLLLYGCEPAEVNDDVPADADADADSDGDADADTDTDTDGRTNADALDFDVETTNTLGADDVDWYSLTGSAGHPFRAQVQNPEEGTSEEAFDAVVAVYDADLNRIAWEDEHPAGEISTYDSVCFGFFPADGTYYLTVQDKRTFEGAQSPAGDAEYTLTLLESGSVPDEPDSLLAIDIGGTFENDNSWYGFPVLIDSAGDVDYILAALNHSDGAIAVVTAQNIEGSKAIPVVEAYNSAGDYIFSAATSAAADGRQILNTLDDTYVIAVSSSDGGGGNDHGAWVFILSTDEGYGNPRESEINDTQRAADVLEMKDLAPSIGTWYAGYGEGHVESATSSDYFRFDNYDDGAYISIAFGAQSYGSLLVGKITLFAADGDELAHQGGEAGIDPQLSNVGPLDAGEYYVRIASETDGGAAVGGVGEAGAYRFAAHVTSVPL